MSYVIGWGRVEHNLILNYLGPRELIRVDNCWWGTLRNAKRFASEAEAAFYIEKQKHWVGYTKIVYIHPINDLIMSEV